MVQTGVNLQQGSGLFNRERYGDEVDIDHMSYEQLQEFEKQFGPEVKKKTIHEDLLEVRRLYGEPRDGLKAHTAC